MTHTKHQPFTAMPILSLLMVASMAATGVRCARATELIPSLGITKSTDTNAGDAQGFGSLALRAPLTPFLKLEGGIAYRSDSYAGGALQVRQWPVTASAWLMPTPSLYVGGGLGWYHTTLDYSAALPIQDSTSDKAGVHIGGGFGLPLAPRLSLDVNGRYIFMSKDEATIAVPTTFNPDYWTTSIGLAIGF